jgi:transcriptional regulator with XRE-family HTH domain
VRLTRPGALIHAARLKAGLSQAALAERAGTTQPTISMYERGAKVPDLVTLERILGAAGFELRMVLAPLEDHDESLARYVQSLPRDAQERFAAAQQARVAT